MAAYVMKRQQTLVSFWWQEIFHLPPLLPPFFKNRPNEYSLQREKSLNLKNSMRTNTICFTLSLAQYFGSASGISLDLSSKMYRL
jgi:hypothetical protein